MGGGWPMCDEGRAEWLRTALGSVIELLFVLFSEPAHGLFKLADRSLLVGTGTAQNSFCRISDVFDCPVPAETGRLEEKAY